MSDPNKRGHLARPELRLHLDCTFAAVRSGAVQIRQYLATHGIAEKVIWACELAFVEGCNNAVQHTPAIHSSKKILIELSLLLGEVELRINDHSLGCDFPERATLPPADCESGRGLFLMRSLMDNVTYVRTDSSNCLVLKKALTGI